MRHGSKLREDDWRGILDQHHAWLGSDGREGQQADLTGMDLSGRNLQGGKALQRSSDHRSGVSGPISLVNVALWFKRKYFRILWRRRPTSVT